jgi:hypothetical protein
MIFDEFNVIYVNNQQNMNDFYTIISNDFTDTCLYTYAHAYVHSYAEKETVDCVSFHLLCSIKFVHMQVRK